MTIATGAYFIIGLALLIVGAELLVRGASRLASAMGITPLVIGLTVVALGTSAPELAVSLSAARGGTGGLALGNVIGSNIFNVLFVLGLSAAITPLMVSVQLVRLDVPIMIGVSVLMLILGLDGGIGRIDGIVLVALLLIYTIVLIRLSRRETAEAQAEYASLGSPTGGKLFIQIGLIIAGLAMLLLGARWMVSAAVEMAKAWGVGDLVIGLTIVAAGTSLPEVATSIMASIRGQRDIAVGNVVGSSIFNVLAILGITATVVPIPVSAGALWFDIPLMIAVAALCLPIFFTGGAVARWEGVLFFGFYVAYTIYLLLHAREHEALAAYRAIVFFIALPASIIFSLVLAMMSIRRGRALPWKVAASKNE